MTRPTINCPKCDGLGKIALHDALYEVFRVVAKNPGIAVPAIHHRLRNHQHIGFTAVNNRLDDLLAMDLVKREKRGRAWAWFVKEKSA